MSWIDLLIGLFVGFTLGAFTMCLMIIAKDDCNPGSETGVEDEK